MGVKEKLPGLKAESGHRKRNIVVGVVYVFVALMVFGALAGPEGDVESTDTSAPDTDATAEEEEAAMESEPASDSDSDSDISAEDIEEDTDEEEIEAAETETETEADATAEGSSEADLTPSDMEEFLNAEGYDVEVADNDGEIVVDYYSTATDETELAGDLGGISGAYAALVDGGYETDRMVIEVQTPRGEPVGQASVSAEDAQAYADGEISNDEYARIVFDSIETYD